jgi:hypothetical protein
LLDLAISRYCLGNESHLELEDGSL